MLRMSAVHTFQVLPIWFYLLTGRAPVIQVWIDLLYSHPAVFKIRSTQLVNGINDMLFCMFFHYSNLMYSRYLFTTLKPIDS